MFMGVNGDLGYWGYVGGDISNRLIGYVYYCAGLEGVSSKSNKFMD
jgi:hypothetical protein